MSAMNFILLYYYSIFCLCLDEEDAKEKDSSCGLGEGGDSGGLVPGKSLVFAAMELLMFILVRHMPHLSTKMSDSPSHSFSRIQLPEESARLVAATVAILSDLPTLCSPAGSIIDLSQNLISGFHKMLILFSFF